MAIRLTTEHGLLTSYAVVLLAEDRGRLRTVRVFDNAHDRHDMHRYTRDGRKQPAEVFHLGTPAEAMVAAEDAVKDGWVEMVRAWRA